MTAFSTITAAHTLQEAGINRAHAEAIAETVLQSHRAERGDLATRSDIALLRADMAEAKAELRTEIAELRTDIAELRTDIAELRTEIAGVKNNLQTEITRVRTEINGVKNDLQTEITKVKKDMFWMKAIGGTIVTLLLAIAGQTFFGTG